MGTATGSSVTTGSSAAGTVGSDADGDAETGVRRRESRQNRTATKVGKREATQSFGARARLENVCRCMNWGKRPNRSVGGDGTGKVRIREGQNAYTLCGLPLPPNPIIGCSSAHPHFDGFWPSLNRPVDAQHIGAFSNPQEWRDPSESGWLFTGHPLRRVCDAQGPPCRLKPGQTRSGPRPPRLR